MKIWQVLVALAVSFAAALVQPTIAFACTCPGTAFFGSDPKDGATGVPRNKAIVMQGLFEADSVVLEDPMGQSVEFTSDSGLTPGCNGTWIELIPKQPLEPNTTYTIRALRTSKLPTIEDPSPRTFTTGSEMLDDAEPAKPVGKASVVLNVPEQSSCETGKAMTCVGMTPHENIEVIARRGDRMLMRWFVESAADWVFAFDEVPDCMEFRYHSETGKRSEPLTICGAALATREFRKSDLDPEQNADVLCRAGVIGDPDAADANEKPRSRADGCSAAPGARALSAPWLLFLALVLAAYVSRPANARSYPCRWVATTKVVEAPVHLTPPVKPSRFPPASMKAGEALTAGDPAKSRLARCDRGRDPTG